MRYIVVLVRFHLPEVYTPRQRFASISEAIEDALVHIERFDWYYILDTTSWTKLKGGPIGELSPPAGQAGTVESPWPTARASRA